MDRRKALKNIGLGAGFLVATPTVVSLLQSCQDKPAAAVVVPKYFSVEEGHAVKQIVDLIIPSDDKVPGAVDVGVHDFFDAYMDQVAPAEQQQMNKVLLAALAEKFQADFGKGIEEGTAEDYDQLLATYLKADKEVQAGYGQSMGEFFAAAAEDPALKPDTDAAVYSLLSSLQGMTIWAWKTSEAIGKNVLWYDPVPGQQIGCIPVEDANGGKVRAL